MMAIIIVTNQALVMLELDYNFIACFVFEAFRPFHLKCFMFTFYEKTKKRVSLRMWSKSLFGSPGPPHKTFQFGT